MIIRMLKSWMILTNGIWERGSESASFFLSIFGHYMQKEADKSIEEKFFNFPLVFICVFWYNWKRTNVLKKNSHTDFPYRLLCAILCYGILNSTAWSGKSVLVTLFV